MVTERKIYQDPSQPVNRRIEDLLKRMSLEEKVGQLQAGHPMCYGYRKRDGKIELTEEFKAMLTGTAIGQLGALLRTDPYFGIGVEEALSRREGAELVNRVHRYVMENSRLGIPALVGDDGIHGQLGIGTTIFPALCGMGSSWNTDLQEEMARAMACEMRAQGLTVIYAPDLDVIRDPRYGRCEENFGEDPYLVGQMGRAMVRGFQGESLSTDHSVVALLRAYPGMGDAEGGHDFTRMGLGRREMQEVILRPWREAIEEGAQGVMVERAEYDGDPAPGSSYYLNELLREEWGFEGIAIGDAEPLYPFGYGLSYTTFEYTHLTVLPDRIKADETARVSVDVTNKGSVGGDEVVQLYVRDEVCSVVRPWKQLKGFKRVHLEPDETKTVSFDVGWNELCFYGADGRWVVEPGEFTLMISRHAREDLLSTSLTVG